MSKEEIKSLTSEVSDDEINEKDYNTSRTKYLEKQKIKYFTYFQSKNI